MASPDISVHRLMGSISDISTWLRKVKNKVTSHDRSLDVLELMKICQEVEKSMICKYACACSVLSFIVDIRGLPHAAILEGGRGEGTLKTF